MQSNSDSVVWVLCMFSLFGAVVFPCVASADGVRVKEGAGGVVPIKDDSIRMLREHIDIEVERSGSLSDDKQVKVTVTYTFKNETDKTVNLSVGFPVKADRAEQYMQGEGYLKKWQVDHVKNFEVLVDGKSVGHRSVKGAVNPALTDIDFDRYMVWRMSFEPGQERQVVNSYLCSAECDIYGYCRRFKYVLRTGKYWRGTIGEVTASIRFNDKVCLTDSYTGYGCIGGLLAEAGYELYDEETQKKSLSAGWSSAHEEVPDIGFPGMTWLTDNRGATELHLRLRDVEPERDIMFGYQSASAARQKVLSVIGRYSFSECSVEELLEIRYTLLALGGMKIEDPAHRNRMKARGWYVVFCESEKCLPSRVKKLLIKVGRALFRARFQKTN